MIGFGIPNRVVTFDVILASYWQKCKMDFCHCIVLMHFFISGRICDYPLHNLSLSYTPPKNANRLPTKTNFSTPIARDPCRLKAPIQSLIIQWSALFWFLNLERSAKGYYVRKICVCIMLDLEGGGIEKTPPPGKLKYHSDYSPPPQKKLFFGPRMCLYTRVSISVCFRWCLLTLEPN